MLVSFHASSLPHDEQTVTEMRHKQAVFVFFCFFSVNISVNILSLQETDETDFSTFAFQSLNKILVKNNNNNSNNKDIFSPSQTGLHIR